MNLIKKNNEIPIPFGYFSSKREMDEFQKRDLLSKELILCVGNIYSNYHERIIKNSMKIHCIDIPMLSIDYNRLYMRAVNEMLLAGKNIYGKGNYVRTLGSIIRTEYVKEITCPEQYKLIRTLFDTDKMNLRNRIMHGTYSLFNYFSINISAILMQLLWDIMDESIFIDSSCSNGCNPKKSKL